MLLNTQKNMERYFKYMIDLLIGLFGTSQNYPVICIGSFFSF